MTGRLEGSRLPYKADMSLLDCTGARISGCWSLRSDHRYDLIVCAVVFLSVQASCQLSPDKAHKHTVVVWAPWLVSWQGCWKVRGSAGSRLVRRDFGVLYFCSEGSPQQVITQAFESTLVQYAKVLFLFWVCLVLCAYTVVLLYTTFKTSRFLFSF